MSKALRQRLTYANVMSTLAFFLVVTGGTVYAANTIGSADVIDNSLESRDVKDSTLLNVDIQPGTIGGGRILDGTLTAADVANDSLTATDINEQASSLVRAYARVGTSCTEGPGTNECNLTRAKGITKVTHVGLGQYCVTAPGLDSDLVPAMATVDWNLTSNPQGNASAMSGGQSNAACPTPATDFVVYTERQPAVTVDKNNVSSSQTVSGIAGQDDNIGFHILIP